MSSCSCSGCSVGAAGTRADDPGFVSKDDRVDPVTDPELHQDPGYVGLDRRLADDQLGGDLTVRPAGGHELEHLELTRRELLETGRGIEWSACDGELPNQAPGDAG